MLYLDLDTVLCSSLDFFGNAWETGWGRGNHTVSGECTSIDESACRVQDRNYFMCLTTDNLKNEGTTKSVIMLSVLPLSLCVSVYLLASDSHS